MQITPQIALYVLLLLPGLLGHALFSAFTYRATPTWTGRTIVAILLTAASYLSIWMMRSWSLFSGISNPASFLTIGDEGIGRLITSDTLICIVLACGLSVLYALLLTAMDNRRVIFKFARWLHITTRSGFTSEWDAVMLEFARDRWVMAILKDGSAFTGWLVSHDVASLGRAIVLKKIRQYDKDGENFDWPPDELLYLDNLAEIRGLRLIPTREPDNGQEVEHRSGTEGDEGEEVRQHEPKPSAEGETPGVPD